MMQCALTVDVEGSWLDNPQEQAAFDASPILSWLASLEEELLRAEDQHSTHIPVTWFVRCDDSVAHALGSPQGLLQVCADFVARRRAHGDVFGLHPHFYSKDAQGQWFVTGEAHQQNAILDRAVTGWEQFFGERPILSRMGEALMTDTLARHLAHLGLLLDATALSGRQRQGAGYFIDWQGAPHQPYRPSRQDYRVPASGPEQALAFTEVPFSMVPIQAPYDTQPLLRYFNLAYHPALLAKGLPFLPKHTPVVAVVHPHELSRCQPAGPLVAFDPQALHDNLKNLKEHFGELEFVTFTTQRFFVEHTHA